MHARQPFQRAAFFAARVGASSVLHRQTPRRERPRCRSGFALRARAGVAHALVQHRVPVRPKDARILSRTCRRLCRCAAPGCAADQDHVLRVLWIAWWPPAPSNLDVFTPAITSTSMALCSAPSMPRCCAPTATEYVRGFGHGPRLRAARCPGIYVMAGDRMADVDATFRAGVF
jgi:hypothetical protein